ncbi:hypothetical protein NDI76_01770 [Halogeometricum sp. S1BR25-6]|uniref:DUF8080 domain-containing protein n=1 Tax=Halogeometricum salsisoli TaxID=2950536 RepID=A0ABU2GAY2_9EURY|nr:hypothetical protein [Halogeometricum sp. S1BR25-6]MDS0297469.1 hypothetical protein [Halogeometricum sp. S1BR25-6]
MEHDCTTESVAGATLVTVRVRNEAPVPRRVRVRNELPGPVLPPRREGVPERGWDESGFEGVLDAGEERTLGYACPVASEGDRPVSVASLGRAEGEREDDRENEAIRALGRARPPADAVPVSVPDSSLASESPSDGDAFEPAESDVSAENSSEPDVNGSNPKPRPPAVASWFDAVETRVRLAERLTDATAADAASALETAGDVSGLASAVAADEAALRAVAARADELADRAAETEAGPVVAALEAP